MTGLDDNIFLSLAYSGVDVLKYIEEAGESTQSSHSKIQAHGMALAEGSGMGKAEGSLSWREAEKTRPPQGAETLPHTPCPGWCPPTWP